MVLGELYQNAPAVWSIRYTTDPDNGEIYFVRFTFDRCPHLPSSSLIQIRLGSLLEGVTGRAGTR
jgi:hypothetical protein